MLFGVSGLLLLLLLLLIDCIRVNHANKYVSCTACRVTLLMSTLFIKVKKMAVKSISTVYCIAAQTTAG